MDHRNLWALSISEACRVFLRHVVRVWPAPSPWDTEPGLSRATNHCPVSNFKVFPLISWWNGMAKGDKEPLPIYESKPPEWLPKSHVSSDLGASSIYALGPPLLTSWSFGSTGFVGFYPPRPDQEEEILTETNVKNGLILGLSVPVRWMFFTCIIRSNIV